MSSLSKNCPNLNFHCPVCQSHSIALLPGRQVWSSKIWASGDTRLEVIWGYVSQLPKNMWKCCCLLACLEQRVIIAKHHYKCIILLGLFHQGVLLGFIIIMCIYSLKRHKWIKLNTLTPGHNQLVVRWWCVYPFFTHLTVTINACIRFFFAPNMCYYTVHTQEEQNLKFSW